MRLPLYVRPLTDAEREALTAGLRSSDAVTLRRCPILLASARGERPAAIARSLGCSDQTVRNTIPAAARPDPGRALLEKIRANVMGGWGDAA